MRIIVLGLTTILCCCLKNSSAQQNLLLSKRQAIGLNFHYGFIVQHKLVSDHLITQHIPGFDILIQKHSTGSEWQYRYQLPYFGYMLSYYNLGDSETIGNAFAAMYHVDFRLKYNQMKGGINFRAGAGLGYVTQRFDIRDNFKNTIIGSRLNSAFKFQLDFYRYITWLNKISLGLSFTHFSSTKCRNKYRRPQFILHSLVWQNSIYSNFRPSRFQKGIHVVCLVWRIFKTDFALFIGKTTCFNLTKCVCLSAFTKKKFGSCI